MRTLKITTGILLTALLLWLAGYVEFCIFSSGVRFKTARGGGTEAIVVLTGGNYRIKTGLGLFAAGQAGHLFISGVNPKVSRQKIENMWNGEPGLPLCCITLGHDASTTRENAQEVRRWLIKQSYTSVQLVTSGYHMRRAMLEFRHALPGIDIIPRPVQRKDYGLRDKKFWALTFSEYNKTLFRSLTLLFTPKQPLTHDKAEG